MKKNKTKEGEIFLQFLKNRRLSFTRQRKVIFEHIIKNHDHFEVKHIIEALRKRKLRVSRATVYRTLAHLEECRLIKKMDLGHGYSHFEHTFGYKHHEHLCCEKCGKIVEFVDSILEKRIKKILELNLFNKTNHNVRILGICKNCQK